jgi:hypothetical protein
MAFKSIRRLFDFGEKGSFDQQIRIFLFVSRLTGSNTWEDGWVVGRKIIKPLVIFIMVFSELIQIWYLQFLDALEDFVAAVEVITCSNVTIVMIGMTLFYRRDLQEMFDMMRTSWTYMKENVSDKEQKVFLRHHKIARIYFMSHITVQGTIIILYLFGPFLLHGGNKWLIPVALPGSERNDLVNYFFHLTYVVGTTTSTITIGYIFILQAIYFAMRISLLVHELRTDYGRNQAFRNFHVDHLKLMKLAKQINGMFLVFGIIYTTQVAAYICVNVYLMTQVKSDYAKM